MQLKYIIDKKYDKAMISESKLPKRYEAILENQYRKCLRYLTLSMNAYQASWDEINDEFYKYIEKETGYEWFYPTYKCVVSFLHPGISNWGYDEIIVRWWQENPFYQRRITAHELILSHYFEIYRRHYHVFGLSDQQVWALAEIAAFALTSLPTNVKKFWPWDYSGYYYDHNYPEIVSLQKKLKNKFLNRKNFDDYIAQGIKLVKKPAR